MKKAIQLIVAAAFLLLTLSACYKLDGKAVVSAETDTVSGEVSVAINKAVGKTPPATNLPTGVVAYPIQSKSLIGYKYVLTNTPVAELQSGNALGIPLWITKNEVGYGISGDFSEYAQQEESKDAPVLPQSLISLSIALPNPITAPTGLESAVSGGTINLTNEHIVSNPVFIFAPNSSSVINPSPEPTPEPTATPQPPSSVGGSVIPNFGDDILPDPREGIWPIPSTARSPIPSLILWIIILAGVATAAFGHATLNGASKPTKTKREAKVKKNKKERLGG